MLLLLFEIIAGRTSSNKKWEREWRMSRFGRLQANGVHIQCKKNNALYLKIILFFSFKI